MSASNTAVKATTVRTQRAAKPAKPAAVAPATLVAAPTPAAPTAAPMLLQLTAQGAASAARQGLITVQRSAPGQGLQWRSIGIRAASLRAQALHAILATANDKGHIPTSAALVALKGVNLGSKTPATRISAFLRAGLLAPVTK